MLQSSSSMADWKQITARIRRARTSKDPLAQLTALFEKTGDAMVAFEVGKFLESKNENPEAARWYATAAEKFRRADWKTKAQEASARLGGGKPFAIAAPPSGASDSGARSETSIIQPVAVPEPALPFIQNAEVLETIAGHLEPSSTESTESTPQPASDSPGPTARRGRRRGRRGGRNRRSAAAASGSANPSVAPSSVTTAPPAAARSRASSSTALPQVPVEPIDSGPAPKGRFGDPGLSSRLSLLEMQFRRLLSCPPARLNEADRAPAGPGVFVLTDEDMTTYYYVEACDTLRIAIAQLARGSAGRRGNAQLKAQMAGHLGIPESRVAKYLTEHCVVRWLQLDEGAPYFAHFAIAVLRPTLNE
jgi:hypothetical protein